MIQEKQKSEDILRKEELLADIERLIQYDANQKDAINPKLLQYLERDSLISIKKILLERVGKLSDEDKLWLKKFRAREE